MRLLILSDIHYCGPSERHRRGHEARAIANPFLRSAASAYRRWIWLADPYAHNPLLEHVLRSFPNPDWVLANGDFSVDSGFIGIADNASLESASLCIGHLRAKYGDRLRTTVGDHELGKASLFGKVGGPRWRSFERLEPELELLPFWTQAIGRWTWIGVTSSLLALPLFDSEILPEEREQWNAARASHIGDITQALDALPPDHQWILCCHDPSALPFLAEIPAVRAKLPRLRQTLIGHLHSQTVLKLAKHLRILPRLDFLGNTARRLSRAVRKIDTWQPFHVTLCPSLTGIEWSKDGGVLTAEWNPESDSPPKYQFEPLSWDHSRRRSD